MGWGVDEYKSCLMTTDHSKKSNFIYDVNTQPDINSIFRKLSFKNL